MPYIRQEQRHDIDILVDALAPLLKDPGRMNYAISRLIHRTVEREGQSYDCFNAILGVLDAVAKEFYRRVVAPYEERKMEQNGDVYTVERAVNVLPSNGYHASADGSNFLS